MTDADAVEMFDMATEAEGISSSISYLAAQLAIMGEHVGGEEGHAAYGAMEYAESIGKRQDVLVGKLYGWQEGNVREH